MKKEFVPYDIALAMKELGFDEDCFACYTKDKELSLDYSDNKGEGHYFQDCATPLYQQAFRWFRENFNLNSWTFEKDGEIRFIIKRLNGITVYEYPPNEELDTYGLDEFCLWEEAQYACLRKLIEIVKDIKK